MTDQTIVRPRYSGHGEVILEATAQDFYEIIQIQAGEKVSDQAEISDACWLT